MKILIVDDDKRRSEDLAHYLSGSLGIDRSHVVLVECVDDAKKALRAGYYDTVVIDVVLPKRSSGGAASPEFGLALLDQLCRDSFLKKPERIIGITAHSDHLPAFRVRFDALCQIVVEASVTSAGWKATIASAIRYAIESKVSRQIQDAGVCVFTIHGIRTFGQWQGRLEQLVARFTDGVSFRTYKYGYFSTLSFLLPFIRTREVKKLSKRLGPVLREIDAKHIVVFAHSFGTYLAVHALKRAIRDFESALPRITLVLCGSVLDANFDWSFLDRYSEIRIVNDCGDSDHVLWASKAIALGMGMGGKCGFNGFSGRRFMNRYFAGAHSHYFDGEAFMSTNWVPLIVRPSQDLDPVDFRRDRGAIYLGFEEFVRSIGSVKPFIYIALVLLFLYEIYLRFALR